MLRSAPELLGPRRSATGWISAVDVLDSHRCHASCATTASVSRWSRSGRPTASLRHPKLWKATHRDNPSSRAYSAMLSRLASVRAMASPWTSRAIKSWWSVFRDPRDAGRAIRDALFWSACAARCISGWVLKLCVFLVHFEEAFDHRDEARCRCTRI